MGFLRTETVTRRWTYVGEIDELRAAGLRVIDAWDNGTGSVVDAIDALRAVLEPKPVEVEKETRFSWTEDYYDYDKGEK